MKTPDITNAVPSNSQGLSGSSSTSAAMTRVDIGPTMPACEARAEPMRSIDSITNTTGKTVQRLALSTESHHTAASRSTTTLKGRNTANCPTHSTQATQLARPTRRKAPRRPTHSPL